MRSINNDSLDKEKSYPFAKWICWLFLAASMLLLFYTYYRAELTNREAVGSMYFKYYLISVFGVIFWGVVLKLNGVVRANIVTICISLVFGIYIFEAGLNLFVGNGKSTNKLVSELSIEYDRRTKLEVIGDLIAKGVVAVPTKGSSYSPNNGKLFPFSGISEKTTVGGNETGQYMIYQSDRYGFNNPDFEWDAEQIEWLLTGDSFVFGEGLQPGENFADQIRLSTQENVINLGGGGNSPIMELAVLEEYAKILKPNKVIWFYYEGNDLVHDLPRDKSNKLLMQYMKDGFSQNLINRQIEINKILQKYIISEHLKAKSRENVIRKVKKNKFQWVKLYAIRNLIGFDSYIEIDPLFNDILTKAKSRVEAWGGEMYFVYLPEYNRYQVKRFSHDRFRKKAEIIELVKGLDIPVIDIHKEVFSNNSDPLSMFPFRIPGHYNSDTYAKVSKVIIARVIEYEKTKNK